MCLAAPDKPSKPYNVGKPYDYFQIYRVIRESENKCKTSHDTITLFFNYIVMCNTI